LQELEVLAKDLLGEAIKVNGLPTSLVNTVGLLLDLFVLKDDELLNGHHLVAVALDGDQLIVRLGLLNLKEDLEDIVVLVLHLNEAEFLLFVLTHEADQLSALLNLVE